MIPVRQCNSASDVRQLAIETARRLRARYGGGPAARVAPEFIDTPPNFYEQKRAELAEERLKRLEQQNAEIRALALKAQATIDMMKARKAASEERENRSISVRFVRSWFLETTGATEVDLKSSRRQKELVKIRQSYMWLCRKVTLASLPQIGKSCGDRDHTTVLHAWRKLDALCETDAALKTELEALAAGVTAAWNARVAEALAMVGGEQLALPIGGDE